MYPGDSVIYTVEYDTLGLGTESASTGSAISPG